jgi:hypothetical protein
MLRAVNRIEIALVLNHHAGTKKCRFNAAHNWLGRRTAEDSLSRIRFNSEIPDDDPRERRVE